MVRFEMSGAQVWSCGHASAILIAISTRATSRNRLKHRLWRLRYDDNFVRDKYCRVKGSEHAWVRTRRGEESMLRGIAHG